MSTLVSLTTCTLETPIETVLTHFDPEKRQQIGVIENPLGGGQTQIFHVLSNSLHNMLGMGLGYLPVKTIAIPERGSNIIQSRLQDTLIRDVSNHLSDYFPNFFVAALYELQAFFEEERVNAYIVGGITRDMLMSNERRFEIQDIDITVESNGIDVAKKLASESRNFKLIGTFDQFGTSKLSYKDRLTIDIASTRRERYKTCSSLPEVIELGVPLVKDIIRRDFTVNALALSIHDLGKVIDCHSGIKDLEARCLQVLKPSSFYEDPSRILRLLKFWVRLDFPPAKDTQYLLESFMSNIPACYRGGGERIKDELLDFLSLPESPTKRDALQFFTQNHLHRLIDTQLDATLDWPLPLDVIAFRMEQLHSRCQEALGDDWDCLDDDAHIYMLLILGSFNDTHSWHAADRLILTKAERDALTQVLQLMKENHISQLSHAFHKPSEIYTIFHRLSPIAACVGIVLSHNFETAISAYITYRNTFEAVDIELDGNDLMALGLPQGESIKHMLAGLKAAKLDGDVHSRLDEIEWVKQHLT